MCSMPIKVFIDSSADGHRAAFVALIVEDGKKPRLIYGTGGSVSYSNVEAWGIKRALKRVNTEHHGSRPIVIFTDGQRLVLEQIGGHVRIAGCRVTATSPGCNGAQAFAAWRRSTTRVTAISMNTPLGHVGAEVHGSSAAVNMFINMMCRHDNSDSKSC